ncbi:TBP family protein [Methanogenium organophilum]|uniref:TATA-box-binding protein n=1 Tax=Methanogenium organophilum TaxID=2199 RepID=A0A9X9T7X8_METOG|nr:hypothetical protein [Methanogenium organophilum]WAI00552.1 hypothetical protein OU421_08935 [Methanogenium organophilum]
MRKLEIVNVVATGTLTESLDLEKLHQNLPGTVKSTSHWLKYRLPENNKYIAFYKSGKFLLTGKDVLDKQDELCARILDILRKADVAYTLDHLTINNIVCKTSVKLNKSLDVIIEQADPKKGSYEPEQFPGLIYKDWGVSFLLFSSGSVIITGAKKIEESQNGFNNFVQFLSKI